jgi:hypothetical protein
MHRYKIWELAKNGRPQRGKPGSGSARQVADLVALMALYDYRPLIQTELRGSFTSPNGGSANCKTTTISSEEVHLVYDEPTGNPAAKRSDELRTGSAVHLDLDQIGAFHGVVAAKKSEGIRVTVDDKCKPMVRDKLTYMAAEHAVSIENASAAGEPSITRIEPSIKSCSFLDHTGTLRQGTIVNLSQVDALIRSRIVPPLKSRIVLRGPRRHLAEVTRTFEMGFVVRFCAVIRPEEFSSAIKFSDE